MSPASSESPPASLTGSSPSLDGTRREAELWSSEGGDKEADGLVGGEKTSREGLSGSGLLLPETRAWRLRGGGPALLPWLPAAEDDGETTTGSTAACGGVAGSAAEFPTATLVGGASFSCMGVFGANCGDVTASEGSRMLRLSPMETERDIFAMELAVGLM